MVSVPDSAIPIIDLGDSSQSGCGQSDAETPRLRSMGSPSSEPAAGSAAPAGSLEPEPDSDGNLPCWVGCGRRGKLGPLPNGFVKESERSSRSLCRPCMAGMRCLARQALKMTPDQKADWCLLKKTDPAAYKQRVLAVRIGDRSEPGLLDRTDRPGVLLSWSSFGAKVSSSVSSSMVHKTILLLHGEWVHHLTVKEGRTLAEAEQLWTDAKRDSTVPKQATDRGPRFALRCGSVALGESKMTRAL